MGVQSGPMEIMGLNIFSIDPSFSDTASFCEAYAVLPSQSANCVIVEAKWSDRKQFVACVVLATTKVDVNGLLRKQLDCRKASFASMDDAVTQTGMEYGAITPIGLPEDWVILIDSRVVATDRVIIGGGIRKSKLLVTGGFLKKIPGAVMVEGLGIEKI